MLPVQLHSDEILSHILSHDTTILIGETGSGKSTQIPQLLLAYGKIAVTQPRRVAAINLATRVAQETQSRVGDTIGYSVRFDHKLSSKTKCKYVTDGMLLRELVSDKQLKNYDTVIIDEAHERTVLTDLLIGFLKELQQQRKLRIVIMSATLNAESFSRFFHNAPILHVRGRRFPVQQLYLREPCDDLVEIAIRCVVQINAGEPLGDVLCFLPGQEEIDRAVTFLERITPEIRQRGFPLMVGMPLYASLPPSEQLRVFQKVKGKQQSRKVIFCTNVAETSITVPGVKYVVDSGLRRVKVWRHALNLSTLLTVPVSRASAQQRSGRAGRECAGKSYRLFQESDFEKMPLVTEPEIARCDVTEPILLLKRHGVNDVLNWSWFEHPGKESILQALGELLLLGALDARGSLTPLGYRMSSLPLPPQLSVVLIAAEDKQKHCLDTCIDIVACLSVENLLLTPPWEQRDIVNERRIAICHRASRWGDLVLYKELWDRYFKDSPAGDDKRTLCQELYVNQRAMRQVQKVRGQLRGLFRLHEDPDTSAYHALETEEIPAVITCFLSGYPKNLAILHPDRSYKIVTTGETVQPHPASTLFTQRKTDCPAILYTEYVYTSKGYARNVSRLDLSWLGS